MLVVAAALLVIPISVAFSVLLLFVFSMLLRVLPWCVLAFAGWEFFFGRREPSPRRSRGARPEKRPKLHRLLLLAPVGLVMGPAILVLGILMPVLILLTRLAVSRNRELEADVTAVELTRHPAALLGALEKLASSARSGAGLPGAVGAMTIVPVRRTSPDEGWWDTSDLSGPLRTWVERALRWGRGIRTLLSTHPPLAERIRRVRRMLPEEGSGDPGSEERRLPLCA